MHIIGINASQRKDGNSYQLIKSAFEGVRDEDESIKTDIIHLSDFEIKPCKVLSVDAKGGIKKKKNLEDARTLGSLVAKTLIKRKSKDEKKT